MIKRSLLFFTLFASPAWAGDPRIQSRAYNDQTVVTVAGRAGIQSTIEFAPDERIENVAIGDSSRWQITPNRRANLLFVKPMGAAARTNMTVVTDRRTYLFDLIANGAGARALYALRFTYPQEKITPAREKQAQASAPAPTPAKPAQLNFAWSVKGPAQLRPQRVYDDGRALYLVWSKDVPLPAIVTSGDDGSEGALSYSVNGDLIVVDSVPDRLVLRSGRESAVLTRTTTPNSPSPRPTQTAER